MGLVRNKKMSLKHWGVTGSQQHKQMYYYAYFSIGKGKSK